MHSLSHFKSNVKYVSKIILKKPGFLFRLGINYIKYFINPNRPPLRFVDVAVSYNCNMKCAHCSATEMRQNKKDQLSVEEYKLIARKLIDAGMLVLNLTGGEPLLRKDIYDIIKVFQPGKILIAVQTNATLLTEETFKKLAEAGVDSIGISIDSSFPEKHDEFRSSPGAYEQAVKSLRRGKELGFNMGISYCLTHDSMNSADRDGMIKLSRECNAFLNYNLAVPIGFWKGEYQNLITPEDRKKLNDEIATNPLSKTDFQTTYWKEGCGAIKEKIYVTAYGEVIPCPFIQVKFGNILTDDFEEIRDRAFQFKYFQTYSSKCIAAEDMDFIKNTKCYSKEAEKYQMPISHEEAFFDNEAAIGKKS